VAAVLYICSGWLAPASVPSGADLGQGHHRGERTAGPAYRGGAT
jgi:hypothetical protein